MSREALLKRFNELLDDNTSFYNEVCSFNKRTKSTVELLAPSQVIIKLHDDKYKFTQTDIDKFLTNALYNNSNNYDNYTGVYLFNECTSWDKRSQAINIMLSKLSCDNVQLIITKCSIYNTKILYKILNGGYVYSEDQIKYLLAKKFYSFIKTIYTVKYMSVNIFKYCLKYCLNYQLGSEWIKTMIAKNKIVVTEDILLSLLEVTDGNNYSLQSEFIVQFLKKNCACTSDTIIKLFRSRHNDIVIKNLSSICSKPDIKILIELCKIGPINLVVKYVELGIKPNLECLNHAVKLPYKKFDKLQNRYEDCVLKSGAFSIFRYMRKFGIIPDINTLLSLCKTNKLSLFKKIVNNYNINPTQECLKNAIIQRNVRLVEIILNHKILPLEDIETFKIIMNNESFDKILKLIVIHGYELNLEMVEFAFKNNKIIYGLDNLGVPYDEKLYYLCYKHDILFNEEKTRERLRSRYSKANRFKSDEYNMAFIKNLGDIVHLRSLCAVPYNNIEIVKTYMINKNIKPDRYCIEYACKYNKKIARYFIQNLKCTPTHNCIRYSDEYKKMCWSYSSINNFINELDNNINDIYMTKRYDHIDLSKLAA
uniref:Uncharacterized protein n=1 Tax=Mimivirus LCMiAC02 TaxID=2506609 RepID=A0A4D5XEZ3_9VIRU|nr:MAG: hypothetical protein LCMiAC02_03630 [Mimivirus LCMiAC02]